MKTFIFFHILSLFKLTYEIYNSGENWAVLACGSSGYMNYRHQADIFHVYHTLINRGFTKEHIILFAFDDIAYDKKNPFQGEVYNRPDGPNVYKDVIIDYSFNMVNPENYISVLKGDNKNGRLKKVLNSTKDDNIFLYFSDHGINGAMVFPDKKFLYADELQEAFEFMHKKNMYKNIIYYMESCYSGSIFSELNPELNIYALTAASPKEQSLATFCYPDDFVKGIEMHTCLSNEFTMNWLDDIDTRFEFNKCNNIKEVYSSREQFRVIKNLTKNSHVQEYGNFTVGELPITLFQSSNDCLLYKDDEFDKKEKEKEDSNYDDIIKKISELDIDEDEDENKGKEEEEDMNLFFDTLSNKINKDIENWHKNENDNYIINYLNNKNKPNEINQEKYKLFPKLKNSKKSRKKSINKIPSKKVNLYYLELEQNQSKEKFNEFQKEKEEIYKSKYIFTLIKIKLNINDEKISHNKKIDYKCLRFSIQLFKDECTLNERDLEFISTLSDICSFKDIKLDDISNAIIEVCKNNK